ncbi:putative periplasmic or exported protein [Yersinia rohdei]|uniref:Putative periplasmic or exported protein n=1 Tax=Yersinia rohdei TaxID=29485 RepID=A0A0U1HMX6_YERRO|nr:YebY family protein [Yersinia rohdei]CQI87684.1 putative periplasmic or exported protein [Yersinia rohdei]
MKVFVLALSLLMLSVNAIAAGKIITVSKFEFGKQWAFTREEVMLECRSGGALFVINPSTLAQYPLNDIATEQMKAGYVLAKPLDVLLLDDSEQPGVKMSLEPFQQRAMTLCQK